MATHLQTYIQDHHAGSVVGVQLARRAARSNEGTEYGDELALLADEIAADQDALEELMEAEGVKPNPVKDGVAWTAEKLGRLKPNNQLTGYSPLSRVVELEGLTLGITGKLGMWAALREVLGDRHAGTDFARLETRAKDQQQRVDVLRRRACAEAFSES